MTVRGPQINMKYLITFLIVNYNALTKTCYKVQMSSKITNLDGYYKPPRLAKFESL